MGRPLGHEVSIEYRVQSIECKDTGLSLSLVTYHFSSHVLMHNF